MDKFQTHSRIMLEADVREATLRYMEKNGTETFSEALNALARVGGGRAAPVRGDRPGEIGMAVLEDGLGRKNQSGNGG